MGKLRLSVKERERSEVLLKVSQSSISLSKASELLGVSYRQVLRIWKRYQSAGVSGWKHGLRDRASNRRFDVGRRERVLELYRAKYGDFGPTLAVEYLVKCDGETLSEETLRQWLIGAGMWSPRRRGDHIVNGVSVASTGVSWSKWTDRITTGSRVVAGRRR